MPEITEEQLRPFPEPEWLAPPEHPEVVGLLLLLGLVVLVVGVVVWRKRKQRASNPSWQALRMLLDLRTQLAVLNAASHADAILSADTNRQKTLMFILDSAQVTLRTWSQLWTEFDTRLTEDRGSADPASRAQAVEKLAQLLTELEQARFCGRCPNERWLAAQLELATALLARLLCGPKLP